MSSTNNLLVLVDENDNLLGYESRTNCHRGQGMLHRAFSIFLFNEKKQLLIHQRSEKKELWPLYWSNSACSHPRKGEGYNEAAERRLFEELGVNCSLAFLYKFQYQAPFLDIGSENEMCAVFLGKTGDRVSVDPGEIAQWRYIDLENLDRQIAREPQLFTPWFKMEWHRIKKDHMADIRTL